jgi:hypothetical protein
LVANHPEQRCFRIDFDGDGATVELHGGHELATPVF